MADNPDIKTTAAGVWTLVGENLQHAHFAPTKKGTYYWTYRVTGDPPPGNSQEKLFLGRKGESIESVRAFDVYIFSIQDGVIRIDNMAKH